VHLFQQHDELVNFSRVSAGRHLSQESAARFGRHVLQKMEPPEKGEPDSGVGMKFGFSGQALDREICDHDTGDPDSYRDHGVPKISPS
jgi:hypothetical protein